MPLMIYCTAALTSFLDSIKYITFYFRNGILVVWPNFLSYQNDWENYRAYLAVTDKNKAEAVFKGYCIH